jgi:hypothetical protein
MKYRYAGKYSANPGTNDNLFLIPKDVRQMMDYRPPFEVIAQDMGYKLDGEIMKAVASVGVIVNKEELVAALQRERDQYKMGFRDGYTAFKAYLKMASRRRRKTEND